MKAVFNSILFGLMIYSNLATAQTEPYEFPLDTASHLASARRFPYTGKIAITQNSPNPFSVQSSTTIRFKAIDVLNAQLLIYSQEGEIVRQIKLKPGVGQVVVDGEQLAPGLYVYALIVNGRRMAARRMLVLDDMNNKIQ